MGKACEVRSGCVGWVICFGFDHINRNAPVLIRTPKLTRFEPAQYWGGGPPGNSVVLNPSFWVLFVFAFGVLFCFHAVRVACDCVCWSSEGAEVSCGRG